MTGWTRHQGFWRLVGAAAMRRRAERAPIVRAERAGAEEAPQSHVKRRMWTLSTSPIRTRKATHDDPP